MLLLKNNIPIYMEVYIMNNSFGTIHLLCGKICAGKSTYAKKLHQENNGIILSCDELVLSIFDEHLGDKHEEIVDRCKEYLYKLSIQMATSGYNVILDMGFWSKLERDTTKARFKNLDIPTKLHYIYVDDETQLLHIKERNSHLSKNCYYVDETILTKCNGLFETPSSEELSN